MVQIIESNADQFDQFWGLEINPNSVGTHNWDGRVLLVTGCCLAPSKSNNHVAGTNIRDHCLLKCEVNNLKYTICSLRYGKTENFTLDIPFESNVKFYNESSDNNCSLHLFGRFVACDGDEDQLVDTKQQPTKDSKQAAPADDAMWFGNGIHASDDESSDDDSDFVALDNEDSSSSDAEGSSSDNAEESFSDDAENLLTSSTSSKSKKVDETMDGDDSDDDSDEFASRKPKSDASTTPRDSKSLKRSLNQVSNTKSNSSTKKKLKSDVISAEDFTKSIKQMIRQSGNQLDSTALGKSINERYGASFKALRISDKKNSQVKLKQYLSEKKNVFKITADGKFHVV